MKLTVKQLQIKSIKTMKKFVLNIYNMYVRGDSWWFQVVYLIQGSLTHYSPVLLIYTPWKHGGIDKQYRAVMG